VRLLPLLAVLASSAPATLVAAEDADLSATGATSGDGLFSRLHLNGITEGRSTALMLERRSWA
jgi:hypothetical protein